MKTSDEPIIVEQTFSLSIETVWNSLTEIEQMRQWYFENIPAFKPEIGFKTQFNIQSNDRNFLHKWEVTKVQPLKMIEYCWEFEDYPGKSTATFELLRQDKLTKLRLTIEILENFPENIPEFTRESCIAGWNYFINNNLRYFLKRK
jgi:uncharacterized protein YndB with AHSA1/START domain